MIDIKKNQMHEIGETQLSGGEFSSAVDSFNSILENDPHDFFRAQGTAACISSSEGHG